jgi:hypothetical protein
VEIRIGYASKPLWGCDLHLKTGLENMSRKLFYSVDKRHNPVTLAV